MKYEWFEEYATSKKGAYKEYKAEWEADRYMIRDKMFMYRGINDSNGREIITLKLEPEMGQALREQSDGDIVPGYYMNKIHWSSVYIEGNVSDDLLRSMIDEAYQLILESFSKKAQREILEG
ncbi:MAG: MmcQ/YjbR family DNA-binding protein [Coriobacteriia bacterium]|nr:MmcQ/YjbR family DNA-binding protein [Coriobacteriia bacterium]